VNGEEQKTFYSGKKKDHTIKNYLIIDSSCRIVYLSNSVEGKMNDKKLADLNKVDVPEGSCMLQDSGFPSFELPNCEILQPFKKPRGKQLTPFQKASNRILSTSRVFVEHVLGSAKRFRSVHDVCRMKIEGIENTLMQICSGLHNFILRLNPWQHMPEPGRSF
jgi:DDE superfamily endonuclease